MGHHTSAGFVPGEDDGELDRLLATWAEERHLPPATAEAIKRAVMAESRAAASLDYRWWANLFAGTVAVLRHSGDVRNYLPRAGRHSFSYTP